MAALPGVQTFVHDFQGFSVFITVEGETIESTYGHPFWVVRGEDLGNRRCPATSWLRRARPRLAGG